MPCHLLRGNWYVCMHLPFTSSELILTTLTTERDRQALQTHGSLMLGKGHIIVASSA